MKPFFIKTYKIIKDKYWADPVWSKVISAGIIAILGSIFTTIYLVAKALIEKISFRQSFNSLWEYLKGSSGVNNVVIIFCLAFVLLTCIIFLIRLLRDIRNKNATAETESNDGELPIV